MVIYLNRPHTLRQQQESIVGSRSIDTHRDAIDLWYAAWNGYDYCTRTLRQEPVIAYSTVRMIQGDSITDR